MNINISFYFTTEAQSIQSLGFIFIQSGGRDWTKELIPAEISFKS